MDRQQTDTEAINRFKQAKEFEEILRQAGRHARMIHKRLGNPVATWRDGKVVIVPPEEIPVDDEADRPQRGEGQ
jgi:hypothetical protein